MGIGAEAPLSDVCPIRLKYAGHSMGIADIEQQPVFRQVVAPPPGL
ncbi:MAG: hypothetical protein JWQ22_134 [Devosia sp.]|nr:hypothetical protein [Devosia sp.]